MTIQFTNGQMLFSGGQIAMAPACCCAEEGPCGCTGDMPTQCLVTFSGFHDDRPTGCNCSPLNGECLMDVYGCYVMGYMHLPGVMLDCFETEDFCQDYVAFSASILPNNNDPGFVTVIAQMSGYQPWYLYGEARIAQPFSCENLDVTVNMEVQPEYDGAWCYQSGVTVRIRAA